MFFFKAKFCLQLTFSTLENLQIPRDPGQGKAQPTFPPRVKTICFAFRKWFLFVWRSPVRKEYIWRVFEAEQLTTFDNLFFPFLYSLYSLTNSLPSSWASSCVCLFPIWNWATLSYITMWLGLENSIFIVIAMQCKVKSVLDLGQNAEVVVRSRNKVF